MRTFGNFLEFNPDDHILLTDGCFYGHKGMLRVAPPLEVKKLEVSFNTWWRTQEPPAYHRKIIGSFSVLSFPKELGRIISWL